MYGARNNTIRNFILTFAAGWLAGQLLAITPKTDFSFDSKPSSIQRGK